MQTRRRCQIRKHVDPLFADEDDYRHFRERHERDRYKRKEIRKAKGKVFLGYRCGIHYH